MINIRMIRYLNIALAVAIPLIVVVKVYHINKITSFDIDRLDKQLTPFKSFIKPGSRVGYDVHTKYGGIFMAVEHVMVPTLLSLDMTADSMIVLRDKNDTLKTFPKYRIISQNTDKDRIAELIEKIK